VAASAPSPQGDFNFLLGEPSAHGIGAKEEHEQQRLAFVSSKELHDLIRGFLAMCGIHQSVDARVDQNSRLPTPLTGGSETSSPCSWGAR